MSKEPDAPGWPFPDGDGWRAALDASPPGQAWSWRDVAFVVGTGSDPALVPFRIGVNGAGEPLRGGDRPLAEWAAQLAMALDLLAAGALVARGGGTEIPAWQWGEEVTVARETVRHWDKSPCPRVERYRVIRHDKGVRVNLGPGPFADRGREVLSTWVEIGGERLPRLRLYAPATREAEAAPTPAPANESAGPRDTTALRCAARSWLVEWIAGGSHRDRDSTLAAMRAAHPGLGRRGSFAVWRAEVAAKPQLARPGRKSNRNTNN